MMNAVETAMIYFLKEKYVQLQNMYSYVCVDMIQSACAEHIQKTMDKKRKALVHTIKPQ
jgi:hypothetical protein